MKIIFYLIAVIWLNLSAIVYGAAPIDNTDWQVFPSCQQKANQLCGGYYLQPSYPLELTKDLPANQVIIKSGYTKLISKGISNFTEGVTVAQNNQQLTAEQAEVQQNAAGKIESVTATDNVKLISPGVRVLGNSAKFFPQSQYKIIYNANYRLYSRHATGNASQIELFADDQMTLQDASYTTCKPDSKAWLLTTKKLKLNKATGRGEAWHATMYIQDVPVFYWPYVNFPIDKRRQTGFLLPSFGSSSKHGAILATPWYWNIATNYDYTLTPIYMSKRGFKFDNQLRYLNKYSLNILHFNVINHDNAYRHFVREKRAVPGSIAKSDLRYRNLRTNNNRYSFAFANSIRPHADWWININYNKVSDSNYLQDFGQDRGTISNVSNKIVKNTQQQYKLLSSAEESLHDSTLHLEQSIKLEHNNDYGLFNFKTLQYQTLYPFVGPVAEEQYKKLPELAWHSNYMYLPSQARSRVDVNYANFKLRSFDGVIGKTTGQRFHFRPAIERPFIKNYGYIRPRLQLDALSYKDLQISQIDSAKIKSNNPSRVIPIFDVNSRLYFYRKLDNNWQQTLEPRLYYLYVPRASQQRYPIFDSSALEFSYQQLFRDNRYSGLDRVAEANQVTIGSRSRIQTPSGEEKASIGIARTRYFAGLTSHLGENLQFGRWSPIAILLDYRINPQWLLEANLVRQRWNQTRSSTFNAQYKPADDRILNVGYQYNRFSKVPEHQWQTSGIWALKSGFNLLGKFDYDINQKRVAYSLAGVEIEGCCTVLRFAWARSRVAADDLNNKQYNNKFLAQIVFKGFTDVGTLENNYLSGKISGYKALEKF